MANETLINSKEKQQLINDILNYKYHGKKIYLLGTAEFGPTNEPILIDSTVGLYNKFGRTGSLIDAFHSIKYTNKNVQTYLVKTTGEHSTAYINVNTFENEIIENGFIISSSESNEIFDETKIIIDIDNISFNFPKSLNIPNKTYYYKDYPTIGLLSDAINKETRLKYNKIYTYYNVDPVTPTNTAFYCCNQTIMYLYGGHCGLEYNKNMLYHCLETTYDILESEDIDIIVPVNAFLDDIYPNDSEELQYQYNMKYYHSYKDYLTSDVFDNPRSYLDQLITFCAKQLNHGVVTHGVIGFNKKDNISSDYLYEANELKNMYIACLEWNKKQVKDTFHTFLVSCVAGDIRYNFGTIIDNAYLAYATFCASVTITEGTTNIPLSNTISLYQEFSEDILQEFAQEGIVAYRHSPLYEVPVVYDGVTICNNNENYRLFVNVRMVQMIISYLNKLYQFYIGHNMHELIDKNIFEQDTDMILRIVQELGMLTEYDFKISAYYNTGEIKLYLILLTNYMTKAVNICSVINAEFREEV